MLDTTVLQLFCRDEKFVFLDCAYGLHCVAYRPPWMRCQHMSHITLQHIIMFQGITTRNAEHSPPPPPRAHTHTHPCVSKQCPADDVWRIGRGVSPDRVRKTRLTPSESSAGHGLPPQRAPKQCPANGVRRATHAYTILEGSFGQMNFTHCGPLTIKTSLL